jgi:DNA polymerase III subunit gamma/tau
MQAVSRGTSEEVLRQVDHLIGEGHSPVHFARQLVRFLRNAAVAKIAGKDSSLLQISSEERERVGRVAELFGEEDLTRHLQIMLRTHGELGYKQEQRFHLELGLLKMAHAQRLLPIEQLLSDAAAALPAASAGPSRIVSRPSIVGGTSGTTAGASGVRRTEAAPAARPNFVSPFAADSARKGTPRQESAADPASANGPRIVATASAPPQSVIMGAAAPANIQEIAPEQQAIAAPSPIIEPRIEAQQDTRPPQASASDPMERLQGAVLQALSDGNQRILVSMLEAGEWSTQGNEVVIKVSESQTVIDMSVSADAKRLAIASASGVLGRAVKLRIVPGASTAPQNTDGNGAKSNGSATASGPKIGGRSRAEQDPIVQRMRERFGAEIRTVIDYKDRK